jgi:hypothetical protein
MESEISEISEEEQDYILFIESLELKLNKQYKNIIKLQGKLLHETENINILFDVFLYKSTEINPFEADIEISIEFIENEAPYVQIMTNFLEPTLYDIKNYFLCLSKKKDYIFQSKYMGKCQIVFLEIISNMQIFLYHLYNCELFKTFVYFGEYNMNHIYHINNFLQNNEIIDFFRINRIDNEKFYEKILYIIITELHLIVFEPNDNNKSLCKILFYKKLSEIFINCEEVKYSTKDKTTKKLKVSIKDIKNNILFIKKHDKNMINDKIKILKKDNNSKSNQYIPKSNEIIIKEKNYKIVDFNKKENQEDNYDNKVKTLNSNQSIINYNQNNSCNKFEFLFINEEEKDDLKFENLKKEYENYKKFEQKKKVLVENEYQNIISAYWLIFNYLNDLNKTGYSLQENIDEIDKLIEYNEKLFNKYSKRKTNVDKKILNNAINNIIFLCSEITSTLINGKDNIINNYVEKIRKYSK